MRPTKPALKIAALTACLLALFACTEKTYITNPPAVETDQRPPLVEWVAVGGRADSYPPYYAVSDTVTLTLSATDSSGIDSVKLYINGFSSSRADLNPPYFTFLWNTLSDSDGVYSLEARAWDKAGNVGVSPALLLRVSNTTPPPPLDRTPPRIRIISPAPSSTVRDTLMLEFEVTDSSRIDSLQLFSSGELAMVLAGQDDPHYIVSMNSWRLSNGLRMLEIRAYDTAGNIGISNPLGLTIDNHRVIWVPDDYEKIQGAINASVDGDTVRVRAGEYNEQLQFFDKSVSLVSEVGPEETIIDGTGYYTGIWVTGGQDTTMMIRGFTFRNLGDYPEGRYGAYFVGASPRIVNNIFNGTPNIDRRGMQVGQNNVIIRNNLFINLRTGVEIGHSFGADFSNNMMVDIQNNGLWSVAATGQLLAPDFNLFWNVARFDSSYFSYGPHNIIGREPHFLDGTYQLSPESVGVNQGRPDLYDLDSTISDIGVYGGPFHYPSPNER